MDPVIKDGPAVSVIMPVYNSGRFIAEAIDSILNQTIRDFELIIIDDCSTDDTVDIVGGYRDERIRFIQKQENTGHIESLNMGLALSLGRLIARMDADDVSINTRLEKQMNFLDSHPEIAVCGTWYETFPVKSTVRNPVDSGSIKLALLDCCPLGHPTVMLCKTFLVGQQLHYDTAFCAAEDYDLWTRIAPIGKMANIPEVLLRYRVHENQISATQQATQVKNSNLCRARMLLYPKQAVSELDVKISLLIAEKRKLASLRTLIQVIEWLDVLQRDNSRTPFFEPEQFGQYVERKKAALVRTYCLHTTDYDPTLLFRFCNSGMRFSKYFSKEEWLRFALKCLTFRRTRKRTDGERNNFLQAF